jgi:hypothetical protein
MDVRGEIVRIEAALEARGVSVAELCRQGAVARSTWDRWGNGVTVPNMDTWLRVTRAAEVILRDTAEPAPKADPAQPTADAA